VALTAGSGLAERGLAGRAIVNLRTRRNMSARALSLKSGHSVGYVWKLETGAIEPSLRGFARIAKALDMTPFELWVIVQAEAALEETVA
jgi:transcriptional regulator with XRE-family HTH domain